MAIDYAEEILQGSIRAVARLMSWLEDEDERAYPCMEKLYPHTGKSYIIGITGSPGAGKSTLTDKLVRTIRKKDLSVGIIAVDPSSPFTGGAVLGDRVRMSELTTDPEIFIRSMATRGFLGGMAKATNDVVKVLDALGKDIIVIETVGVGQDEVDIIDLADTTCLVLVPGLGDGIQSMKSGVMEIADVFIINKADRAGADQIFSEVTARVEQDSHIMERNWTPPVVQTVAVEDQGIEGLWDAIDRHRQHIQTGEVFIEKRRERTQKETLRMIHSEMFRIIREHLEANGQLEQFVSDILNRKRDPYSVMRQIVNSCISLPQSQR